MVYVASKRSAAPVAASTAQLVGPRTRTSSHKRAGDNTSCSSEMESAFLSHLMASGGALHAHFSSNPPAVAHDTLLQEANLESLPATLSYSEADMLHEADVLHGCSSSVFNGGLLLSHPGSSPGSCISIAHPAPAAAAAPASMQTDAARCTQLQRELEDARVTIERLCDQVLQEQERCMALQEELEDERAAALELSKLRVENLELKRRINYLAAAPDALPPFATGPTLQCTTVRASASPSPCSSPRPPSTTGHSSVEPPLTPATLGRSPKPPKPLSTTAAAPGDPPTSFSPSPSTTSTTSTGPNSRQSSLPSPTALPARPPTVLQFGWPAEPPPSQPPSRPSSPPSAAGPPSIPPSLPSLCTPTAAPGQLTPTPARTHPSTPPSHDPSPATSQPPSPAPPSPDYPPSTILPLASQLPMGLLLLPAARTLSRAATLIAHRSFKLLLPDATPFSAAPASAAPTPAPSTPTVARSATATNSSGDAVTDNDAPSSEGRAAAATNGTDSAMASNGTDGPSPGNDDAQALPRHAWATPAAPDRLAPAWAFGTAAAADADAGAGCSAASFVATAHRPISATPCSAASRSAAATPALPHAPPPAAATPHSPHARPAPAASPPLTPVIGRPCDTSLAPQAFNHLLFDPRAGAAATLPWAIATDPTPALCSTPVTTATAPAATLPALLALEGVLWSPDAVGCSQPPATPADAPAGPCSHPDDPPSPHFTPLLAPFAPTPDTPSMSVSLTDTPSYTRPSAAAGTPTSRRVTPLPQRPPHTLPAAPPAVAAVATSPHPPGRSSLTPRSTTPPLPSPQANSRSPIASNANPTPSPPTSRPASPNPSPRGPRSPLNLTIFAQISASMSGTSSAGSPPSSALAFSRSSSHASLHDFRIDRIHPAPPSFDPPSLEPFADAFPHASPFSKPSAHYPSPSLTPRTPHQSADITPYPPTSPHVAAALTAGWVQPAGSSPGGASPREGSPPPPPLLLLECPSLVDVCGVEELRRLPSSAREAPTITWWGQGGYFSESKQQELQRQRAEAATRKQAKAARAAARQAPS